MNRRIFCFGTAFALSCFWPVRMAAATGTPGALVFERTATGEFTFDTGVLRGKLRANGKSAGLSSVIHVPTGARLDASMGLFSHYRLFTENRRYGSAAWDLPSTGNVESDGSVVVRWPAADDRPFELSAVYRWTAPNTLELETRVTARADLKGFESFLASYFSSAFTNAAVCVREPEGRKFLRAGLDAGIWLAFPQDDHAKALIRDGRWKIEPNPVDWVLMPELGEPLAYRRAPATGLVAVISAPPGEAFALLTPYEAEPHYSTYLSLFGRDLKPGETARAHARLVLLTNATDQEILQLPSFKPRQ